jgi:lipid-binding SYLF domain-containing protein
MKSNLPKCARIVLLLLIASLQSTVGCSVAPSVDDRQAFVVEARDGLGYFETNVNGLRDQINRSAGYAVFPGAGQWGIIFTGGSFGRGAVFTPSGTQIGWAAENQFNVGLQAGGQGKKILIVFADQPTLDKFKKGFLTGKVEGLAVAADKGTTGTASFQDGVAVYVGAQKGLMAGGMIGMENFQYRELGKEDDAK